jgi:hypothetical protein
VNLHVTEVARCTSKNSKTFPLETLKLLKMAASCEPPDGESILHNFADEPLIQQNSVSDRKAASPV